ncbi:MAG: Tat pathway signal protein [Martelella sp.]|uniref:tripartite tricarboxylate transporter permease n=1 Tax=unclassified Martelella TaxID=2629616 RepID=UPI000C4A4914|nr:tripartite tricarboxylate transporter permease [Martelella sp.]MAU19713.1 Tat pathway signal protein [Martelella sp.]|tara:strand:- start:2278 stop:3768 length:1491 start_codon:yes stop_codon:yes gene_type:complete
MFDLFFSSMVHLFEPKLLLLMMIGVSVGLVFGALPGLSATMAIAIMLPVTFAMQSDAGIAMLIATYIGGVSGGLVSATLLRIPGTPSSIATTFDGYPLARKGQAIKALATGMVASAVGGILGLMILVAFAPVIARFAIDFGAAEYTALTIAALVLVVVLSEANLIKGLIASVLGLGLSTIGFAPIGSAQRFTFGNIDLLSGISIIPFMVGLFAVAQLIRDISETSPKIEEKLDLRGAGVKLAEFVSNGVNMLRSAAIGIAIGVLPGIGGSASNLVAYGAARSASKKPEEFGKGSLEGIYAAETANNASVGGALLPLLTLGIPGDGVTAILIGGFTIHGLQPGPLLYKNEPGLIATIYAAFLLATLALLLVQLLTIRIFPRVLLIPRHYLIPVLALLMVVGVYVGEYRTFDLWIMLGFGVAGYVLERYGFPLSPLVLGFVLGTIFETNFRRALMYSDGDWSTFVIRPVSAVLLAMALALLSYSLWRIFRRRNGVRAR